jgi:hypothetical protein
MNDKAELVSVVYDIINEIGKNKIRSDVTSNIKVGDEYIQIIFNKALKQFRYRMNSDSLIKIYEILLHFMLTACTIPSQRKIEIANCSIDIIIPSLNALLKSPSNAMIVQFIRGNKDMANITELPSLLQLKTEVLSIWLITPLDLHAENMTHVIKLSKQEMCCSHIIRDIDTFLKGRTDKSFRLIHF